jgi:hypothetical protein
MATIKISRESAYSGRLRKLKVVVNGKTIGRIGDGETKDFDVKDGNNKLWLKVDWCRSNKVAFSAQDSEVIYFECGPGLRGSKIWLSLLYVLFAPHKCILLKQSSKSTVVYK